MWSVADISATVTAISTVLLTAIAAVQLRAIAKQIRLSRESERRIATLDVCQRYVYDPIIQSAAERIWARSDGGRNYTKFGVDDHEIVTVMLQHEAIAVGVKQGLYVEEIIRDNMSQAYYKVVHAYILGRSGSLPGVQWTSNKVLCEPEEYPFTMWLYQRWFGKDPDTAYKMPD